MKIKAMKNIKILSLFSPKRKPSKNIWADYEFVKRTILSCTKRKHIQTTINLVSLFGKRHNDNVLNEGLDYLLRKICVQINY